MIALANARNSVSYDNYLATSEIYNVELKQYSPSLNETDLNSRLNLKEDGQRFYTQQQLIALAKNSRIVSSQVDVLIQADYSLYPYFNLVRF